LKSLQENESFKLKEWRREWISFSNQWQEGIELYPVKAKGDALAISKALYEEYFVQRKKSKYHFQTGGNRVLLVTR
jgi:alpha-N-acetylglucosaminidase